MVITREELIKCVAKSAKMPVTTVRRIVNCLEDEVVDHLSSATQDEVVLKLFAGLTLKCKMSTPKLRGFMSNYESVTKLKPKCEITSTFVDKVNENAK